MSCVVPSVILPNTADWWGSATSKWGAHSEPALGTGSTKGRQAELRKADQPPTYHA